MGQHPDPDEFHDQDPDDEQPGRSTRATGCRCGN